MAAAEEHDVVEATVLRATPKQLRVRLERPDGEELTVRTDVPDAVRDGLEGQRLPVRLTTTRGRARAELVTPLDDEAGAAAPASEIATSPAFEAPAAEDAPSTATPVDAPTDAAEGAGSASPAAAPAAASSPPAPPAAPAVDDTTVPDGLREAAEALRAARTAAPA